MKKIVIEQNQPQQGGAYLKIEDGKLLLGIWNENQETVMELHPRDVAGIRAFLNGVTSYAVDGAAMPLPWHVNGIVHEVTP